MGLGPLRNDGGFCAAGENFSKNDQDQWKMTEILFSWVYSIYFLVKILHDHEKFKKYSKFWKISKKKSKKKIEKKIENFCQKKNHKKNVNFWPKIWDLNSEEAPEFKNGVFVRVW